MLRANSIKKKGIHTNAIVTDIRTVRYSKGGLVDHITLEYKDRATGQPYNGKASASHQKFKIGDNMSVAYLPKNPSKYAIDNKGAYWAILIFSILLFAFAIFAVFKVTEMSEAQNF